MRRHWLLSAPPSYCMRCCLCVFVPLYLCFYHTPNSHPTLSLSVDYVCCCCCKALPIVCMLFVNCAHCCMAPLGNTTLCVGKETLCICSTLGRVSRGIVGALLPLQQAAVSVMPSNLVVGGVDAAARLLQALSCCVVLYCRKFVSCGGVCCGRVCGTA